MALLRWLYPEKCLSCKSLISTEQLCDDCRDGLKCYGRISHCDDFTSAYAAYSYGQIERNLMHSLKFNGLHTVSKFFAYEMANLLQQHEVAREIDIVTYVPISLQRAHERGYSQSYRIAREVAKIIKKPCVKTLSKTRHTAKQSQSKNAQERAENVRGSYKVIHKDLTGKRILLVDDVWTTGSTMFECNQMLRDAGASNIYGITALKV